MVNNNLKNHKALEKCLLEEFAKNESKFYPPAYKCNARKQYMKHEVSSLYVIRLNPKEYLNHPVWGRYLR